MVRFSVVGREKVQTAVAIPTFLSMTTCYSNKRRIYSKATACKNRSGLVPPTSNGCSPRSVAWTPGAEHERQHFVT